MMRCSSKLWTKIPGHLESFFGLGSDTGEQEAEQTEQVMVAVSK